MITSPGNSAAIEARTIPKVRARIIPFVFILFVVAVLDRNNIGFAALTMNKELGITSQQYGFVAGIFFFGYFIFEIPSNLLLHRIGARVWIARILVTWGIVTIVSGFARTAHELYAARFLLGFAEAGYFPTDVEMAALRKFMRYPRTTVRGPKAEVTTKRDGETASR